MTPSSSPPHEGEKKTGKILIIGSRGMLGQELVRIFAKDNDVVAWDRDEIDITEAQNVNRKVQSLRPDLLINAAAYNDVDRAESEPEIANQINGYAVGYLALATGKLNIPIVHYSTDYVFDGEKQKGYRESDKPRPISAYGRSKYLGEQELQKNTDKFYLIRLSRLFGNSGPQGKLSFVQKIFTVGQTSRGLKKSVKVVDEERSLPTYAPDLARLSRDIIQANRPFGIYHGANSGPPVTWHGFAQEVFKISEMNVKLEPEAALKRPARRPKYSVLLNTKLPQMRSWQEALREFLISNF